jgi:hypothetical protein
MKNSSETGSDLIKFTEHDIQLKGLEICKRLLIALNETAEEDGLAFAYKVKNCGLGRLCSSVYCTKCRTRAVRQFDKRISKHIKSRFGNDEDKAHEQIRYATVLCDLVDLNKVEVKRAVANARKDLKALRRKFPEIWMQGTFEFELMDMKYLVESGASTKKGTLAAMKDTEIQKCRSLGQQVLVHFHVLMDLNEVCEKEFKKWVQNRWSCHPRQTRIQRRISGQSLKDMSDNISKYGFKNRNQYNLSFESHGYLKGKWFKDEYLGKLAMVYDCVGKRGYSSLLISTKLPSKTSRLLTSIFV